ncbi:MAG: hypothetical protein FJX36_02615 [Alphaproteobacteria bacterium]|nr:hypothetical protein [Alphaproteobacteria bacterium]
MRQPRDMDRTLEAVLATPLGDLTTRPWFDRFALWGLLRWYVPLSRLWAAAATADVDRFAAESGLERLAGPRRGFARVLLDQHAAAARTASALDARWEAALFGATRLAPERVRDLEVERRAASHAFMMQRLRFLPLLRGVDPPKVRWAVPTPDRAAAEWQAVIADPAQAYRPPRSAQAVSRSSGYEAASAAVSWLRFASPTMGDVVTARVTEPQGPAVATVIVGHGLLVDAELWRTTIGAADAFVALGCRVVEPTSPWHGRRTVPGHYGGEPFIATAPVGPLALLQAQVHETATIVGWCREVFGGPVAVGGVSMSSFATQLVVSHCAAWPAAMRPDAALLVVHHGDPGQLLWSSRLATGLGADGALATAGWTAQRLEPFSKAIAPTARPAIAPDRIVSLLGRRDAVTPFAGGEALCEAWGLPTVNRIVLPGGHFSAPLAALRDRRPFARFVAVARGGR